MSKPRMCPHCRAFVDSKASVCPYCENELPATAGKRIQQEERVRQASPNVGFTTMMLLLINAALFAVSWILTYRAAGGSDLLGNIDGRVLLTLGGKFKFSILYQGEWWRLVTANFLHGGLLHLGFNSMSLYNVGPITEGLFGTSRFLVLYLGSGVCGFLASTIWSDSLSIGASASLCGMIGALYGFGRVNFDPYLKSVAKRWIIAIAIFGFIFPAIDNAAHFGGLAAGFGFAYVCGRPGSSRESESTWNLAAIAAVAITAGAFFMAYQSFSTLVE